MEAKAHAAELSTQGKPLRKHSSANSRANHQRIGEAIRQANAGLRGATGESWNLSRDHHYQLANRFAWTWKLTMRGVPTVLVYLGFLKAEEMRGWFSTKADWERQLRDHASSVVDASCWEKRLTVNGTAFRPLIRALLYHSRLSRQR